MLPPKLVPGSKGASFADLAKAENDARGTVVTGFGVLAAIVVGTAGFLNWRVSQKALQETHDQNASLIDFNTRTLQATERGQVFDLYSKAVDQLGQSGPEKLNA
ncbi:MAG: hypothetical protein ACRDZ8_03010 [Acidimicrobiales bacterium]